MREMTQSEAIRQATYQAMRGDSSVVVVGEGVADPRGIFGTTKGLVTEFGADRVIETPLSENAFTGAAVGMALNGFRPIVTHQRVDFSLLALDQVVNNAAKWRYMFGGQESVPMVIRMIIGRGWGQGAQHSQSLQAIYAHIPGIKVVMPVFAEDAGTLLLSAIKDDNPVIFMEHRWCHYVKGDVDEVVKTEPLGKARVVREGHDVTIVASSYMVLESLEAAEALRKVGIRAEVIDLRTIKPWDKETVIRSVQKTGHVVIADTGPLSFGITGEIAACVTKACWRDLKSAPERLACPDYPVPSSPELAKNYYPGAQQIVEKCLTFLGNAEQNLGLEWTRREAFECDVPNPEFQGPF